MRGREGGQERYHSGKSRKDRFLYRLTDQEIEGVRDGTEAIRGWRELDSVLRGRARREKIWCRHSNALSPAPPEAHSALSCRNTFLIKAYKSCFVRTSPHPIDFKMVNQASSAFDAHKSMATACREAAAASE